MNVDCVESLYCIDHDGNDEDGIATTKYQEGHNSAFALTSEARRCSAVVVV
jgi:hypothetical protein